ncbi:ATP-binding protein [bacterium]|nr:ATP-binding protein [bacterium]
MNYIKTPLYLISIFKNILKDEVISSFIEFLSQLSYSSDFDVILKSYSEFISLLYENTDNQNLYQYLKKLIYTDNNILSEECTNSIKNNENIIDTAKYELSLLDNLLKYDYEKIKSDFMTKFSSCSDIINHLPAYNFADVKPFNIEDIMKSYNNNGYGIFACYKAFKYNEQKEILPVKYFNAMTFSELKNYDYQKEVIKRNTKAFLEGKEANNILLYGDRGCGKSSTVKALINEFSDYNLKIIQVYKESFIYLSELFDKIRKLPLKFIIFADDISFNEDDKNFSSIKAVLEGSLSDKPANTIIYATTNRMHLVKESFSSREGNEVHCNDTIDETVSLSDRFGIMLTFSLLTKREYLDIVTKIAQDCCIEINDELYKKAEEFAALKSIRTPRVARQFIIDYKADK